MNATFYFGRQMTSAITDWVVDAPSSGGFLITRTESLLCYIR